MKGTVLQEKKITSSKASCLEYIKNGLNIYAGAREALFVWYPSATGAYLQETHCSKQQELYRQR